MSVKAAVIAEIQQIAEDNKKRLPALTEEVVRRDPAPVEDEAVGVGRVPAHLAIRRLHDESRRRSRPVSGHVYRPAESDGLADP